MAGGSLAIYALRLDRAALCPDADAAAASTRLRPWDFISIAWARGAPWKRCSDFSRLSLRNAPLDLQQINVETRISTFTLLLASFSGKLSHQQ